MKPLQEQEVEEQDNRPMDAQAEHDLDLATNPHKPTKAGMDKLLEIANQQEK